MGNKATDMGNRESTVLRILLHVFHNHNNTHKNTYYGDDNDDGGVVVPVTLDSPSSIHTMFKLVLSPSTVEFFAVSC